MGRRGTQKPHPHPRNVQYEYPPGVVSTPAARGGVVGCISVFSYFLLFLEIPLDMHLTPDHDTPGRPRRRILIAITPAAALNAAHSRPFPIARLGPISVTAYTHQHTTIHTHDCCCKRRSHMTTAHLDKHGGAFCSPSPSRPPPLLPARSRVPSCGFSADCSCRTHTPTHHTQAWSLLRACSVGSV
jgi:hypothetical protein